MWSFIKSAPILMWVFGAALAAAAWLFLDLGFTKDALEDSREEAAKYKRIVEVTERIDTRDAIVVQAADAAEDAIEEVENADELISPDVAAAWAAGFDSVRNAATQSSDKHVVQRSASDKASR